VQSIRDREVKCRSSRAMRASYCGGRGLGQIDHVAPHRDFAALERLFGDVGVDGCDATFNSTGSPQYHRRVEQLKARFDDDESSSSRRCRRRTLFGRRRVLGEDGSELVLEGGQSCQQRRGIGQTRGLDPIRAVVSRIVRKVSSISVPVQHCVAPVARLAYLVHRLTTVNEGLIRRACALGPAHRDRARCVSATSTRGRCH
jgi:hypothetical protein